MNKITVDFINSILLQYHYSVICPLLSKTREMKKKKKKEMQTPDASFSRIQTHRSIF